jgi:hypothetical protein
MYYAVVDITSSMTEKFSRQSPPCRASKEALRQGTLIKKIISVDNHQKNFHHILGTALSVW